MPKKRNGDIKENPRPQTQIRFQVSAPAGSEVERAFQALLADVPASVRSGLNIGKVFRQILVDNDAEIAAMIREHAKGGDRP